VAWIKWYRADWFVRNTQCLQIVQPGGDVMITNDGATILKQMDVQHPAAKMV